MILSVIVASRVESNLVINFAIECIKLMGLKSPMVVAPSFLGRSTIMALFSSLKSPPASLKK